MVLEVQRNDDLTILSLMGSLNGSATSAIHDQVLAQITDGARVILDLSLVTYLSSAALRLLLSLYRIITERSGSMALAGLTDDVRDIMNVTGFLALFRVYDSRTAAERVM
jgi:anti-sigma B factor antagonist